MKVCFIGRGSVAEFLSSNTEKNADIFLFGFNGLREVSYEKELRGETSLFEEVALLSKQQKSVVVGGCLTNTLNHRRKSALVAENGRLCGVSDMLYPSDGVCSPGVALRIYETKLGKMGVAVAEDLYFPEVVKNLVLCGSDFIVCPFGKITNSVPSVLLRAYSFCYGVPILLSGEGYALLADGTGELSFASPQSPTFAKFDKVTEYHLLQLRRRGKNFLA